MAGYLGTKAVFLSTTTASVGGDSTVGGDLTVDTNTLHVDSANNRVGIGNTSPTQALDVTGDIITSGGVYLGGTGSANKLDDYEEGSFTPTVFDTNGNLTPTYVTEYTFGRYTKIGQLVTFELEVRTSGTSGLKNGFLRLGGLPFNSAPSPSQPSFILSFYNIAFNTGYVYTAEFLGAGSSELYIRESRNNTTSTQMTSSAWSGNNPTLIRISGSYRAA